MNTSVKHLSDTRVELTITLGSEELSNAESVALGKLARTIKAPGFRKGKAPAAVVKKNTDPSVLAEQTLEAALSRAVAEAFTSEEIQVLDRPSVEVKKYVPSQELEFTAEAEVLPSVTLGSYKKLKSKLEKVKVDESDVDEVIDRMRAGFAEKKPVTRAAKDGDEVQIDFVGKKDDVPFDGGAATDYALTLGSNSFIPGFEEGIVGKKVGDEFDLNVTFPEQYHVDDLRGRPVVFSVTLKEVREVALPEVDDEFAAKAGPYEAAKELTDDVKAEITAQKERDAVEKLKDDLVGELVEASEVPVPEILLSDQARSIEQDMVQNLMYRNVTLEQYLADKGFESAEKWRETEVKDAAVRRVKAGLVLAEITKLEAITATDEEINDHIELYKKQYGNNPEMLKRFEEPEVRRDIANRLLTEKTVTRLVELNS